MGIPEDIVIDIRTTTSLKFFLRGRGG